jgi:hypothetical protein
MDLQWRDHEHLLATPTSGSCVATVSEDSAYPTATDLLDILNEGEDAKAAEAKGAKKLKNKQRVSKKHEAGGPCALSRNPPDCAWSPYRHAVLRHDARSTGCTQGLHAASCMDRLRYTNLQSVMPFA